MELPTPLITRESPREIIAADFASLNGGLPIQGGWGYTKDQACIIVKDDPLVDPSRPFDGVGIEHVFVEKRIHEEMIIFQPRGEQFSGIQWTLLKQSLVHDDARSYDHLVFEITGFRDADWEALKAEATGPNGFEHPDFDMQAHQNKRQAAMVRFNRDFWFDITSFFGRRQG